MTITNEQASRAVASVAVEIIQDCRKALGLQVGESLSESVISLRSRLESAERENERLRIENKRWVPNVEIGGAQSPSTSKGETHG